LIAWAEIRQVLVPKKVFHGRAWSSFLFVSQPVLAFWFEQSVNVLEVVFNNT
jgi:hypothetical protein